MRGKMKGQGIMPLWIIFWMSVAKFQLNEALLRSLFQMVLKFLLRVYVYVYIRYVYIIHTGRTDVAMPALLKY